VRIFSSSGVYIRTLVVVSESTVLSEGTLTLTKASQELRHAFLCCYNRPFGLICLKRPKQLQQTVWAHSSETAETATTDRLGMIYNGPFGLIRLKQLQRTVWAHLSETATTYCLGSFVVNELQRTVWAHSSETATTDRLGSFL
jgi:hypothetical protein